MATKEELYEEAKTLDIEGRSDMDKDELEVAIAEARAAGVTQPVSDAAWTRGDGSPATPPGASREEIEKGWSRGADPEDAEAVAAAQQQARLANLGSTGSTAQYDAPPATGGAEARDVADVAAEQAEIRGAAAAREAQKVEQTGATNTTPAPDQEGAVKEGKPAVEEAGTGDAGDKGDYKPGKQSSGSK